MQDSPPLRKTAQDGNAPSTVSVSPKASTNDYTWEELGSIASEISASGSMDAALEIAKGYNLVNADGKLDGTQVKEFELNRRHADGRANHRLLPRRARRWRRQGGHHVSS